MENVIFLFLSHSLALVQCFIDQELAYNNYILVIVVYKNQL